MLLTVNSYLSFILVFTEVLKRLDDASDEVRITAAKTIGLWFKCIDDWYDRTTYKAHLEFLFRGLLVHLDDPDTNLQTTVLGMFYARNFLWSQNGAINYTKCLLADLLKQKLFVWAYPDLAEEAHAMLIACYILPPDI